MTAITICSNFGAPTKNKVSYCFHSNRQNLTVKALFIYFPICHVQLSTKNYKQAKARNDTI